MGWDKNNPENTFFNYAFRYGNSQNAFGDINGYNDEFKSRTPINYPAITGDNNLPIIDIMVFGYDWSNKNGVLFSIDPNILMNKVGTKLTSNSAKCGDCDNNPSWRPDSQIDCTDPMDGFDINHDNNKPKISDLNPRLDVVFGARATKNSETVKPYFSDLENKVTGINTEENSTKLSRFYILYNSLTVSNYLCSRGYRVPNPSNPNAKRNWFSINLDGTSQNAFLKVFYLTYDDWLLNFSPRDGLSFTIKSNYSPRNGDYIARNDINSYNTLYNGQNMYPGSFALYSNDLKYKMYYDFYGKGRLYSLPLTNTISASLKGTILDHNSTQEQNAVVPFLLAMQSDGNIVGYKIKGNNDVGGAVLASGSNNDLTKNNAILVLEAGGVLVGYCKGSGVDGKTIYVDNGWKDRNKIDTTNKYDKNCHYYWRTSASGVEVVDINNGMCYRNPRMKYDWNNNGVAKIDIDKQMIFWYNGDLNSIDIDYPYTYRGSFIISNYFNKSNDTRITEEQRRNINYCMKGSNWLNSDCSNYANTFPTNANLYNLIKYDITNRICSNPNNDNEYKMCAYIKPTLPNSTPNALLQSVISKAPDLKYINSYITENYTFLLPGNKNTNNLGATVATAIKDKSNFTDLELYFIRPYVQAFDNGTIWTNTYTKSLNLSDLPIYTPSDFNISGATLSKFNIYPFIIVYNYNGVINVNGMYVDYIQLKNKDPTIKNNVYQQTSDVWKYICKYTPTKFFEPYSLKTFNITDTNATSAIKSTLGDWMYGLLLGDYKAYNMETLYCGTNTSAPQVYVFTLNDYKTYFIKSHQSQNKIINPHSAPIGDFNKLDSATCSANPDWCYNEYLTYLNDPANFNTSEYVQVCDKLVFTGDNNTNIKNACLTNLGLNKCSNGIYRYNNVPIIASGRTMDEYQLLWNKAGCNTDVSKQYAGALTDTTKKDLWNLYNIAGVTRDMAAYSTSTDANLKKMCYGSAFTNKDTFSGGSCIDICSDANASNDIKEACKTGTIAFCKTGDNIFTNQCNDLLATIPEINDYKTQYCKNNSTDSRCPTIIQPTTTQSDTTTTPIVTQPDTTQPVVQSSDVYNDPKSDSNNNPPEIKTDETKQTNDPILAPSALKSNEPTPISNPQLPPTPIQNNTTPTENKKETAGLSQAAIISIVIAVIFVVILAAVFGFRRLKQMREENIKLVQEAENSINASENENNSENVNLV